MSALSIITRQAIQTINQALEHKEKFEQYKDIRTKIVLYLSLIGWLMRDLCVTFPLRVLKVTFFHTVGVTSGTAVIGFIFLYSRQIANGKPISIYKISLPSVQGPSSIKIAFLITILGCAATLCSYLSEWAIVRLAVDYQCRCQDQLFKLLMDESNRGWAYLLNGPAKKEVLKLQQQTLFIGRIVRILLRSAWPILTFCISISSLILLDFKLTLILLPICLIYSIPLYVANMHAVRSKNEHQKKNIYAKGKVRELVEFIVDGAHSTGEESRIDAETKMLDPSYKQAGNLSFKRLLVSLHTELLNTIFLIIGVFFLFSFAALQSQGPNWSWSKFVLYLVSFRFAITGLKKVTSTFIAISRLIPDFRNYVEFSWKIKVFRTSESNVQSSKSVHEKDLVLRTFPSKIINSNKKINLNANKILWVVLPYSAQTADVEGLAALMSYRITPKTNIISKSDFFIKNQYSDLDIIQQLSELSDQEKSRLITEFKANNLYEKVSHELAMCFEQKLLSLQDLSDTQKWLLQQYKIFLSNKRIIFLNSIFFKKQIPLLDTIIGNNTKQQTFALITQNFNEAQSLSALLEQEKNISFLILDNENKVVASGNRNWITSHTEEINKVLKEEKASNQINLLDLEEEEEI